MTIEEFVQDVLDEVRLIFPESEIIYDYDQMTNGYDLKLRVVHAISVYYASYYIHNGYIEGYTYAVRVAKALIGFIVDQIL